MKSTIFSVSLLAGLSALAMAKPIAHPTPFIISPREEKADENSRILGIKKWRFRINAPARAVIRVRLELHRPGQAPVFLFSSQSVLMESGGSDLLVAVQPIDGDLVDASKLRTRILLGGTTGGSIENNVLRGKSLPGSFMWGTPTRAPDGSWTLLEFGSDFPRPKNARLRLWISPQK